MILTNLDAIGLALEKEGWFVNITRIEGLWYIGLGTDTLYEGYSLFTGMRNILLIQTTKKMLESSPNIKHILTLARNIDLEVLK